MKHALISFLIAIFILCIFYLWPNQQILYQFKDESFFAEINQQKDISSDDPRLGRWDLFCLVGKYGAKYGGSYRNRNIKNCPLFSEEGIILIDGNYCKRMDISKLKISVLYEYDFECKGKKSKFTLHPLKGNEGRVFLVFR